MIKLLLDIFDAQSGFTGNIHREREGEGGREGISELGALTKSIEEEVLNIYIIIYIYIHIHNYIYMYLKLPPQLF